MRFALLSLRCHDGQSIRDRHESLYIYRERDICIFSPVQPGAFVYLFFFSDQVVPKFMWPFS